MCKHGFYLEMWAYIQYTGFILNIIFYFLLSMATVCVFINNLWLVFFYSSFSFQEMYTFMGLTVIRQSSMYDNGILNTIKLKS